MTMTEADSAIFPSVVAGGAAASAAAFDDVAVVGVVRGVAVGDAVHVNALNEGGGKLAAAIAVADTVAAVVVVVATDLVESVVVCGALHRVPPQRSLDHRDRHHFPTDSILTASAVPRGTVEDRALWCGVLWITGLHEA